MTHDHHHDDDAHGHPHPGKGDHPVRAWERREAAIRSLLIEKGLVTAEEIRRKIEEWEQKTPADGARVVARAWSDPAYEARLLADANAAALELGIDSSAVKLVALKNTPRLHHLVVCTLCSCYPRTRPRPAARLVQGQGLSQPRGLASRARCWPNSARCCRRRWSSGSSTAPPTAAISSLPLRPAGSEVLR